MIPKASILLFLFQDITKGPGEGSATDYTLEIIIMLLVAFILGYLLRFFIGNKWKKLSREWQARAEEAEAALASCREKNTKLEGQLSQARYDLEKSNQRIATYRARSADLDIQVKALKEQLTAAGVEAQVREEEHKKEEEAHKGQIQYSAVLKEDMLQIVEGIGPKIETALKNGGIKNWADLSHTKPEEIREKLISMADSFRIHDPSTWPAQAKLAHEGRWEDLVAFQKELDGGKDLGQGKVTDSKAEKMAARLLGITLYHPDDLKLVEGIGPKIEALLKKNGIKDWGDLSRATEDQLKAILDKAGTNFRLARPGTWPKQAELALQGRWQELEEYQDFLQGGVDPAA